MNRKLGRLLEPGLDLFFIVMLVFSAASMIAGAEALALTELVVTGVLYAYYHYSKIKRRKELEAFIQSATNVVGTTDGGRTPFPMALVRMGDGALIWSNDGFVGTAPYRRNEMDENFRRIQRVYLSSHDIRRFGCTALELCYIACGRADGQFEYGTKPWDIAAGWLILREAGGEVVSVWGGNPPLDGESAIVSTNGRFTEELRALM